MIYVQNLFCDWMREGLCATCKAEINETMKVCPNCGTPIIWDPRTQNYPPKTYGPYQGASVSKYPTTAASTMKKKKYRHRVAAFFSLVFSFFMLITISLPWLRFNLPAVGLNEEITLEEYDETFDTDYNGTLAGLAVILMILSFISIAKYNIGLKIIMIILGFISIISGIQVLVDIAEELNNTIAKDIWHFTIAPIFFFIGCILFMISAAIMRSPKKRMLMPLPPYGMQRP